MNDMRRIMTLCEAEVEYGEWKYWVDGGGALTSVDNHDIEAEQWYGDGSEERSMFSDYDEDEEEGSNDPDYGDWRTMAMNDGMARLNLTRTRRGSEIDAEYNQHVGVGALTSIANFIKDEPVDAYYINNQTFTTVRDALRAINVARRQAK